MQPELLIDGFPGWIFNILGSLWVTALFVSFPLLLLMSGLVWYSRRKTTSPPLLLKIAEPQKHHIDYDDLVSTIQKQNGKVRTLLLAASSLSDLPVTVPLNLALRLCRTHTCLLVDLDTKRNAVARVFDLHSDNRPSGTNGSHSTPLEKLDIWPARHFEMLRYTNLQTLIAGAAKKYDYILVYAPYLPALPDRMQAASSAKQAIAFTGQNGSTLKQLLKQCNCKIIREVDCRFPKAARPPADQ